MFSTYLELCQVCADDSTGGSAASRLRFGAGGAGAQLAHQGLPHAGQCQQQVVARYDDKGVGKISNLVCKNL